MGGIGGVDSSTPCVEGIKGKPNWGKEESELTIIRLICVEGLGEILLSIGSVGSPVREVGIWAGAVIHWLNNLYIKDNINKFFYQKFLAVGVV